MNLHSLDKITNVVKSVIRLPRIKKRGRPFTYSAKNIAIFFYAVVLRRITCFKTMHNFLINNSSLALAFGFKE